jgi:hypothetical protein
MESAQSESIPISSNSVLSTNSFTAIPSSSQIIRTIIDHRVSIISVSVAVVEVLQSKMRSEGCSVDDGKEGVSEFGSGKVV